MSSSRRFLIFIVIVMAVVVVAVLFRTQPSLKSILSTDVSKASNAQAVSLPKPAVTTKKPEQPQASLKPKKKEELKPKPSSKPAARSLEATETPKEALKSKQKIQELEKEKAQLNLSLPDEWEAYEWDKPTKYSSYPNFFVPK
ncbi:MAG TPA: hypothetical protein VL020_07390, partial [Pseudomonadales bacterium]|nr:hypothetical protein [Pseudomonadales bacterium]